MPKENTHLFFSHGLLEDLPGDELLRELSWNIDAYYLGAVLPDSFYYSAEGAVASISAFIHGKDGNPTNTLIFEVLDRAPRGADLALILGFITHCALDIVFHPVIYYLSGNYYDPDPENRSRATYWHRHLETGLDIALGNTLRMHALVRPHVLKGLIFEGLVSRHFNVTGSRIRGTIRKQVLLNRVFESRRLYRLARLLLRREFILTDPALLGLFYADVKHPCANLEQRFSYQDPVSGEDLETSVFALMRRARTLAADMMEAAHLYARGRIPRDVLADRIPGLSLDTGRMNTPSSTIRYTAQSTHPEPC